MNFYVLGAAKVKRKEQVGRKVKAVKIKAQHLQNRVRIARRVRMLVKARNSKTRRAEEKRKENENKQSLALVFEVTFFN